MHEYVQPRANTLSPTVHFKRVSENSSKGRIKFFL